MQKKIIKKLIYYLLLILFILVFIISLYHIITYIINEKEIKKELNDININTKIIETNDNAEIINNEENIDEQNIYYDYIKMNLIDVNLTKLKKQNNDTIGWISVNGTNINYPFVQTTDNKYYLTHNFNKEYNYAGWVFMDYRNNISNVNEKNTILYAHGMKNKTMFGSLRNILTSGWLNNKENYIIKISTEYENSLWEVFSVYHIPTTSDYIQTKFNSSDEYQEFLNMLLNRSKHNFNTTISSNDRILTLSTCYNSTDKVVLHAKLIKHEIK